MQWNELFGKQGKRHFSAFTPESAVQNDAKLSQAYLKSLQDHRISYEEIKARQAEFATLYSQIEEDAADILKRQSNRPVGSWETER